MKNIYLDFFHDCVMGFIKYLLKFTKFEYSGYIAFHHWKQRESGRHVTWMGIINSHFPINTLFDCIAVSRSVGYFIGIYLKGYISDIIVISSMSRVYNVIRDIFKNENLIKKLIFISKALKFGFFIQWIKRNYT